MYIHIEKHIKDSCNKKGNVKYSLLSENVSNILKKRNKISNRDISGNKTLVWWPLKQQQNNIGIKQNYLSSIYSLHNILLPY